MNSKSVAVAATGVQTCNADIPEGLRNLAVMVFRVKDGQYF